MCCTLPKKIRCQCFFSNCCGFLGKTVHHWGETIHIRCGGLQVCEFILPVKRTDITTGAARIQALPKYLRYAYPHSFFHLHHIWSYFAGRPQTGTFRPGSILQPRFLTTGISTGFHAYTRSGQYRAGVGETLRFAMTILLVALRPLSTSLLTTRGTRAQSVDYTSSNQ